MWKTRILAIATVVLLPSSGMAQTSGPPPWDASLTVGLFNGRPAARQPVDYGDDWYHTGEIRASVGRLWTDHLKSEFEFGTTGEGSRYVTRGLANGSPIGAREFHRIHQLTGRATWQFSDNSWVQPYVSAGVMVEGDQQRALVYDRTLRSEPSSTTYRPGASLGAGAKFYMTPRTFFKAGAQSTWTNATATVSFLAGFGFDF